MLEFQSLLKFDLNGICTDDYGNMRTQQKNLPIPSLTPQLKLTIIITSIPRKAPTPNSAQSRLGIEFEVRISQMSFKQEQFKVTQETQRNLEEEEEDRQDKHPK